MEELKVKSEECELIHPEIKKKSKKKHKKDQVILEEESSSSINDYKSVSKKHKKKHKRDRITMDEDTPTDENSDFVPPELTKKHKKKHKRDRTITDEDIPTFSDKEETIPKKHKKNRETNTSLTDENFEFIHPELKKKSKKKHKRVCSDEDSSIHSDKDESVPKKHKKNHDEHNTSLTNEDSTECKSKKHKKKLKSNMLDDLSSLIDDNLLSEIESISNENIKRKKKKKHHDLDTVHDKNIISDIEEQQELDSLNVDNVSVKNENSPSIKQHKKNSKIENSCEIISDNKKLNDVETEKEDIFSGIFIKTEPGTNNNIFCSVQDMYDIDNNKPLKEKEQSNESLNNCIETDSIKQDTSMNIFMNMDNSKDESFNFADILSQSHNGKLTGLYKEITRNPSDDDSESSDIDSLNSRSHNKNSQKDDILSQSQNGKLTGLYKEKARNPSDDNSESSDIESLNSKSHNKNSQKDASSPETEKSKKEQFLKLITSNKDINDIEKDLEIFEIENERIQVQDLDIRIITGLPIIHRVAYSCTNWPRLEQKKKLETLGVHVKSGKFTKNEDDLIMQNWKNFCEEHNWDESNYGPFIRTCSMSKRGVLTKEQHRSFILYISQGFEDRYMPNVYLRFCRIITTERKERKIYTAEDDEIITDYIKTKKSSTPFRDLQTILKKPANSILKRYQLLKMKEKCGTETVSWNKELSKELLINIMGTTDCCDLKSLKDRVVKEHEWRLISDKMGIAPQRLKRVWLYEFYPRYYSPNYVTEYRVVRIQLINLLFGKYKDYRDIDWKEVSKNFSDGFTSIKISKMFKDMVYTKVPKKFQKNLEESLKYLKMHYPVEDNLKFRINCVPEILEEIDNGTFLEIDKRKSTNVNNFNEDEIELI